MHSAADSIVESVAANEIADAARASLNNIEISSGLAELFCSAIRYFSSSSSALALSTSICLSDSALSATNRKYDSRMISSFSPLLFSACLHAANTKAVRASAGSWEMWFQSVGAVDSNRFINTGHHRFEDVLNRKESLVYLISSLLNRMTPADLNRCIICMKTVVLAKYLLCESY